MSGPDDCACDREDLEMVSKWRTAPSDQFDGDEPSPWRKEFKCRLCGRRWRWDDGDLQPTPTTGDRYMKDMLGSLLGSDVVDIPFDQ